MKKQVDKQAVKDLLDRIPWAARRIQEVLETVQAVLPLLESGDEAGAMRAAVRIESKRDSYRKGFWTSETIRLQLRSSFLELDHFCDKRAVIEEALATISDVGNKTARLHKMQQQLRDIFINLDARTKAILEIRRELEFVDGRTNPPTDFANLLDHFESVDVDVLRSEPELAPLLDAYDMARAVNETL